MAYRRNLTIKAKFFANQRFPPSISHFNHDPDRQNHNLEEKSNLFHQTRSYGVYGTNPSTRVPFREPKWSQLTASGFLLARNMSTSIGDSGGIDKMEYMDYMADVLTDKTAENVTNVVPAVSEVAVAAADSWLPVAGLQYAIDGIHTFTGLNWWASIAITTLVIKTLLIPFMINHLKASSKLSILAPQIEEMNQELEEKGMRNMAAQSEWDAQRKKLFKEHDVGVFSSVKWALLQGPVVISFFLAINNMVEKVPSFKTGGAFWFLDLTTADPFYILPCLTAFTSWMIVEFNMEPGLDGKSHTMKNVARGFAAISIPIMASWPKGLFCYWISSNLFSLIYGLIIKQKSVKKIFNIPIIVPPPPSPNGQPSFWEGIKRYYDAKAMQYQQTGDSKTTITHQSMNSSQLISQKPYVEVKSSSQGVSPSSDLGYGLKNQGKKSKGMNSPQLLSQKPYAEVKSSNQGVSSLSDLGYGLKNQGKKGKGKKKKRR